MTNWGKWIIPGIIVVAALTIAAIFFQSGIVEKDLTQKASANLEGKHPWATVELDGRDLVLKGTTPTQAALEDAKDLINQAYDVRVIDTQTQLLAEAKPYKLQVAKEGLNVILSGNAPDQITKEKIVAAAKEALPEAQVDDQLVLGRGAPSNYSEMADFAFKQVGGLKNGTATFTDMDYAIDGDANSLDDYDQLIKDLDRKLPKGANLASETVRSETINPYTWSAEYDGENVAVSGHVPSKDARLELEKKIKEQIEGSRVRSRVRIAEGAPENFDAATRYATDFFTYLDSGMASLTDNKLSVSGGAKSPTDYNTAIQKLSDLPDGIELAESNIQPVSQNPFLWAAEKTEGAITLSGFAPGMSRQNAIVADARDTFNGFTINDEMEIAGGASGEYAPMTELSIDALDQLSTGKADWDGSKLTITGIAKDEEAYNKVQNLSGEGFVIDKNVGYAPAAPYRWSMSKNADGVVLRGNAPSINAASDAVDLAKGSLGVAEVTDRQSLASGEPEGFDKGQKFVADAVSKLEAGQGSILDTQILISGRVADEAVKAELEGLSLEGFDVSSNLITPAPPEPEIPTASPYRWSLAKNANGVTVRGNVPNQDAASAAVELAKTSTGSTEVTDRQTVALGEPEGFANAQTFIADALKKLEAGEGSILDDQVLISGRTADEATKAEIESLSLDGFNVSSNVMAPAPPEPEIPTASPYRWSLAKNANGVTVRGNVPSQDAASAAVELAKTSTGSTEVTDRQTVALGEPEGFANAQTFIADALKKLEAGEGSILDDQVLISGRASDEAIKTEVEGMSLNGFVVRSNILAPAPPEPEPEPEPKPDQAEVCRKEILTAIDNRQVFFDTNRATLKNESRVVLDAIVQATSKCPDIRLEIAGYTDDRGAEKFNQELSEARANTVRQYLVDAGVDSALLDAKGYGESKPIANNATSDGRAKNRRIEFNIIQ